MKRFVPAKLHGTLDLGTAGLILTGPEVFRIRDAPGSTTPGRAFALGVMAMSVLTDYGPTKEPLELGGPRVIPMRTHLILDAIGGTVVALAPWVTGTWRKGWNYWTLQTLVGASELFFALTTKIDED
jgi:hypothetical protein